MKKDRKELIWLQPLYIGEEIQDPEDFRKKIDNRKLDRNAFLITLTDNPRNQLELFSAVYMKQEAFWNLCPPILGIAGSKADAVGVIQKITEECLQVTGNCNLKEYLKNR